VQGAMPYIQSCIKKAIYSKLYQKRPIFKVVSKMPYIQSCIKNALYSKLYQKCSIFKVVSKTAYILSKRPIFYQRKSHTGTDGTLRNRSQMMWCFGCTPRHISQGFGGTPRHMSQEILCKSRDLWLVRKQG